MIENAIAGAAAAISLIALFASLWSLKMQRTHNRKSVRPVGHVQLHDSLQTLNVKIVNKGIGPMLIKEFTAVLGDVTKHNIVYHLPEPMLKGYTHQFHTEPEGYWLASGDELVLVGLEGDHMDHGFVNVRERVRSILGELTINLRFSDIYGEEHPVFTKSLSWFKRTM